MTPSAKKQWSGHGRVPPSGVVDQGREWPAQRPFPALMDHLVTVQGASLRRCQRQDPPHYSGRELITRMLMIRYTTRRDTAAATQMRGRSTALHHFARLRRFASLSRGSQPVGRNSVHHTRERLHHIPPSRALGERRRK